MGLGSRYGFEQLMEYLTYSPNIQAYAAVKNDGSWSYYDLSDDVTQASVQRKLDGASTFTVVVANPQGKYTDLFTPFDLVRLYASKDGTQYPLILGYVISTQKYQLYTDSIKISCIDGIGRLQRLYWDPDIVASQEAMGYGQTGWNYSRLIASLVCDAGGFPSDMFHIGTIPPEIMTWAKKLYMSQKQDYVDAEKIASDLYNVLLTVGVSTSSSGSSDTADAGLTAGASVTIPDAYGNGGYTVTLYDEFDGKWASGTNQQAVDELWDADGSVFTNGIATIDGRYLIACTSTFGTVGDRITFVLSDGTTIPSIMADEKNQSDPGCNEWGHDDGQCVIEFEVETSYYYRYGNPGNNGWYEEWKGKRVCSATNYGSVL